MKRFLAVVVFTLGVAGAAIAQEGASATAQSGTTQSAPQSVAPSANATATSPAEERPSGGGVYLPGNGVAPPKLIYSVDPVFPEKERKKHKEGVSIITIVVGPDGQPHNVRPKSPGNPDFDESAIDAVKKYRFEPGTKDGKPVPVIMTVEVHFYIYGRSPWWHRSKPDLPASAAPTP